MVFEDSGKRGRSPQYGNGDAVNVAQSVNCPGAKVYVGGSGELSQLQEVCGVSRHNSCSIIGGSRIVINGNSNSGKLSLRARTT